MADRPIWDANECHGTVTRNGEEDACGKPAVAIIDPTRGITDFDDWPEFDQPWPACVYHAHRWGGGHVVPLAELIRDARGEAWNEGNAFGKDPYQAPWQHAQNPYFRDGMGD